MTTVRRRLALHVIPVVIAAVVGSLMLRPACAQTTKASATTTASSDQTAIAQAYNGSAATRQPTPPSEGQWLIPGRDYGGTRYSELNQINTNNVSSLKVAWTFSTGVNRGQEAPVIVAGDTMYL